MVKVRLFVLLVASLTAGESMSAVKPGMGSLPVPRRESYPALG